MASATKSHPCVKDGWFSEAEGLWPGQQFRLAVKEILHTEHTGLQDVLVFESETYGRVLVIDGIVQLTTRDEFAYQEMITHLPLMIHRSPESVLIVGGGDGGVLREVVHHSGVKKIVMCDIDARVVELSREYFADTTATGFEDPRVTLLHEDAAKFVAAHPNEFDVVIVDSTDPIGPAESLFKKEFYVSMLAGLRDDGIMCTQGECMWLHLELIRRELDNARELFPVVGYAYTTIPTYPSGQIGFILASKDVHCDLTRPSRSLPETVKAGLRYYSPQMHSAAFVLPPFVRSALQSKDAKADKGLEVEEKGM